LAIGASEVERFRTSFKRSVPTDLSIWAYLRGLQNPQVLLWLTNDKKTAKRYLVITVDNVPDSPPGAAVIGDASSMMD
jgi:hypothetical protein